MNEQNDIIYWLDFIIVQHFGSFSLVGALVFGSLQGVHASIVSRKRPELKDGYRKLVLWFTVFMCLPWLPIVLAELIQGFPGILYFFLVGEGNIFSWMFYIIILCEYGFLLIWIWFRKGGEFLFAHPLLFYKMSSPRMYQIFFTLMILGGLFGLSILISLTI